MRKEKESKVIENIKSIHTWGLGADGFQPQILGMNFALIVRLSHHSRGEGHVTYMTHLRPVSVSIVTVLLTKDIQRHQSFMTTRGVICLIKKRRNCTSSLFLCVSKLKPNAGFSLTFYRLAENSPVC